VSEARDEILARVRRAVAGTHATLPKVYLPAPSTLDVVELFAERVADYDVGVRLAEPDAVAVTVADILAAHGARRVAVPDGLPASWQPAGIEWIADDALSTRELDTVDGALTGCALAIAETGTIVLDHGPAQGRRALTLVPDLHVCVVAADAIVPTVPDAFARLGAGSPLTLVSGPSATSDIELSRVRGVHGPRRLEVVISGS
jgi:L-lactate dehydrogenase complex protein LldG